MTGLLTFVLALATSQAPVALTPEVAVALRDVAFQAAREGDQTTLREYFAAGRPVNDTNPRGDTLLVVAAYAGHEPAVTLILDQAGVTVDARNGMGLTALTAAAFQGHVGIARRLVQAGADVNLSNSSGQTALMFAALTGRLAMVEFLLAAKADVRAVDTRGKTALALAEQQGSQEVVARLKEALAGG